MIENTPTFSRVFSPEPSAAPEYPLSEEEIEKLNSLLKEGEQGKILYSLCLIARSPHTPEKDITRLCVKLEQLDLFFQLPPSLSLPILAKAHDAFEERCLEESSYETLLIWLRYLLATNLYSQKRKESLINSLLLSEDFYFYATTHLPKPERMALQRMESFFSLQSFYTDFDDQFNYLIQEKNNENFTYTLPPYPENKKKSFLLFVMEHPFPAAFLSLAPFLSEADWKIVFENTDSSTSHFFSFLRRCFSKEDPKNLCLNFLLDIPSFCRGSADPTQLIEPQLLVFLPFAKNDRIIKHLLQHNTDKLKRALLLNPTGFLKNFTWLLQLESASSFVLTLAEQYSSTLLPIFCALTEEQKGALLTLLNRDSKIALTTCAGWAIYLLPIASSDSISASTLQCLPSFFFRLQEHLPDLLPSIRKRALSPYLPPYANKVLNLLLPEPFPREDSSKMQKFFFELFDFFQSDRNIQSPMRKECIKQLNPERFLGEDWLLPLTTRTPSPHQWRFLLEDVPEDFSHQYDPKNSEWVELFLSAFQRIEILSPPFSKQKLAKELCRLAYTNQPFHTSLLLKKAIVSLSPTSLLFLLNALPQEKVVWRAFSSALLLQEDNRASLLSCLILSSSPPLPPTPLDNFLLEELRLSLTYLEGDREAFLRYVKTAFELSLIESHGINTITLRSFQRLCHAYAKAGFSVFPWIESNTSLKLYLADLYERGGPTELLLSSMNLRLARLLLGNKFLPTLSKRVTHIEEVQSILTLLPHQEKERFISFLQREKPMLIPHLDPDNTSSICNLM